MGSILQNGKLISYGNYNDKGEKTGKWVYGYYDYPYFFAETECTGRMHLLRTCDTKYTKCKNPVYSIESGEYIDNNKTGLWQQIVEDTGSIMSKGIYDHNKRVGEWKLLIEDDYTSVTYYVYDHTNCTFSKNDMNCVIF